ncbi:Uncharacterised protein [Mycobacteroides abscessus subsp. abscessus]|nr:Uncharacterised protein [Mycobacteroides abscessus subsp. abscessus]
MLTKSRAVATASATSCARNSASSPKSAVGTRNSTLATGRSSGLGADLADRNGVKV